ncbi:hypothetical protein ACFL59_14090 [Planctomycetota bacterium]
MTEKRQSSGSPLSIVAVALLAILLYCGAYVANLQGWLSFDGGPRHATYRIGGAFADSFFWPANQLDRLVRPDEWRATGPIHIDDPPNVPPPPLILDGGRQSAGACGE